MEVQKIYSKTQSFGMAWSSERKALDRINKEAIAKNLAIASDKYQRAIEDWTYVQENTPNAMADFCSQGDSLGDIDIYETKKKRLFHNPENTFYHVKSNPDLGDDFFDRFHDSVERLKYIHKGKNLV